MCLFSSSESFSDDSSPLGLGGNNYWTELPDGKWPEPINGGDRKCLFFK